MSNRSQARGTKEANVLCPREGVTGPLNVPALDLPSLQASSHRPLSSWVSNIWMASPSLSHHSVGGFCALLLCHSSRIAFGSLLALCILAAAAIPHRGLPTLASQSPLCHWTPKVGKPQQRPIEQLPGVHIGYDMLKLGLLQGAGRGGG